MPPAAEAGSLQAADVVVVGGRGALEKDNFQLLRKLAGRLGAAVGGTRPVMDMGEVPLRIRSARQAVRFGQRSVCLLGSLGQCSTRKESRIQLCISL